MDTCVHVIFPNEGDLSFTPDNYSTWHRCALVERYALDANLAMINRR